MRLLALLLLVTPALAEEDWRTPRALDGLYARIADDLNAGKPLIIANYYGLWFTRNDQPDRNLNWGVYYGHARMLDRAHKDKHIHKQYQHWRWTKVFEEKAPRDPRRTVVYHQRVRPNRAWRAHGVTAPFDAYLVMQAFSEREEAARRMTRNLRQAKGRTLTVQGRPLPVGDAQITAYFGHNLFYDYPGFRWTGLDQIAGTPARPKGVAAVGCNTGRVPGFDRLVGPNVFVVLYSRSLMASEGYSTLALADGVLRHLKSKPFVRHADRTYQYFQKLGKPGRRVGRPFVSHGHLLYPPPPK